MNKYLIEGAFIQGKKYNSAAEYIVVLDPYTRKTIGKIPSLSAEDIDTAISSAQNALPLWSTVAATERGRLLLDFSEHLLLNKNELGELISLECGKPLVEGLAEVSYAASFFHWFAQEAERIYGRNLSVSDLDIQIKREAIGVCAFITPWNFPLAMLAKKIAPALAAGCTIVAKPAELTPFSGIALAKIAQEIGIPDGVINMVTGSPEMIGKIFCSSPQVQKISFTGSTEVGEILLKQSAPQIKKCSLELGGNAPFIVFKDADMKKTINALLASKFRNGGQTCIASNRFLVHKDILPLLLKKLIPILKGFNVGDPFDSTNELGPMINQAGVEKISRLLLDALEKKAEILLGQSPSTESNLVSPLVLKNVSPKMDIWKEEIFGPVIAIMEFETEEEAIELANDSLHGLASYVMTEDQSKVRRVAQTLRTGLVGVNTGKISMASTPFGGCKQSGLGREGGAEGIEEYLEVKTIFQQF